LAFKALRRREFAGAAAAGAGGGAATAGGTPAFARAIAAFNEVLISSFDGKFTAGGAAAFASANALNSAINSSFVGSFLTALGLLRVAKRAVLATVLILDGLAKAPAAGFSLAAFSAIPTLELELDLLRSFFSV
jgi:hypothetical protein